MIFKVVFITIFSILLIYSLVRPFSSIVARIFLIFGSILGIMTLVGLEYIQFLANILGITRAVDLYLYVGLFTFFLFITFTINRIDGINKKIGLIVKKDAINRAKKENIKND